MQTATDAADVLEIDATEYQTSVKCEPGLRHDFDPLNRTGYTGRNGEQNAYVCIYCGLMADVTGYSVRLPRDMKQDTAAALTKPTKEETATLRRRPIVLMMPAPTDEPKNRWSVKTTREEKAKEKTLASLHLYGIRPVVRPPKAPTLTEE